MDRDDHSLYQRIVMSYCCLLLGAGIFIGGMTAAKNSNENNSWVDALLMDVTVDYGARLLGAIIFGVSLYFMSNHLRGTLCSRPTPQPANNSVDTGHPIGAHHLIEIKEIASSSHPRTSLLTADSSSSSHPSSSSSYNNNDTLGLSSSSISAPEYSFLY